MITRNIKNHLGEIVGQQNFPDGTSEEEIAKRLARYETLPVAKIHDVTPRQIRQALILSGVSLNDILAALESLPEPTRSLALTEWEYSIAFLRNRPLVQQVGQMLSWTPEQLDSLWLFAGTL